MMDAMIINDLRERMIAKIDSQSKGLLSTFPLEKYLKYLESYPEIGSYQYVSREVLDYCSKIVKSSDEHTMELYHKLLLVNLVLRGLSRLKTTTMPGDVISWYERDFGRIIERIEADAEPVGFYKYPQDKFLKDLGVCSLRMIPTGVRKTHLASLPKRFLLQKGLRQLSRGLLFILVEVKGFKPFYTGHIDSNDPNAMSEFNPEGWSRHYKMVADLLKKNPKVKGYFSNSWWYDPNLEKISPRLVYLREVIIENGGKLFYRGSTPQVVKDATFRSPTRRLLHAEGKYTPTNYLIVWPRNHLINWADSRYQH